MTASTPPSSYRPENRSAFAVVSAAVLRRRLLCHAHAAIAGGAGRILEGEGFRK
jgi:hypothetical protein